MLGPRFPGRQVLGQHRDGGCESQYFADHVGAELDGVAEEGSGPEVTPGDGNPLEGYRNLLTAKVMIKGGVIMVDKR